MLKLILGPMWAGKTDRVIREGKRYRAIGKKVLFVTHASDVRYSSDSVATHDGIFEKCLSEDKLSNLLTNQLYCSADVVIIEEAQFFPDLVGFLQIQSDESGKIFVASGLSGDYLRQPIGSILQLVPISESVEKLNGYCNICKDGTIGCFTKRKENCSADQVFVGGAESYEYKDNPNPNSLIQMTSETLASMVDEVISVVTLEREKKPGKTRRLPEASVNRIVRTMNEVFLDEPTLLKLNPPLTICGDIHGQLADLLRMFEFTGYPPQTRYLFLGDYVDRGKHSVEVIMLLFALKLKYPDHIYLLRGNHEDASLNIAYGFRKEVHKKYNVKLWKTFIECFDTMPLSALVAGKILCMHGGLSPHMQNIAEIDDIRRPLTIPDEGLACDLVWSDPDENIVGWAPNDRGVSFLFGADVVADFCRRNKIDLIVRAHQVVEDGYEFFAQKKLVTIFTAPNYTGEFDNSASALQVNEKLGCSLKVLRPIKKRRSSRRRSKSPAK